MTIYVTREGNKLVADSPLELVEKLQQCQGRIQEANLVIRLLQRRFGEIPQNLDIGLASLSFVGV